ncbi:MAG: transposase [Pseudomonadota bacterium]|nr:transposase [Pseudomonadota bacterium]
MTDKKWERIKQQVLQRKRRTEGGRSPADNLLCFEGILWILWAGAPWSELPARYG